MAERICSVEGCTGRVKGRGLCNMHHQRFLKGADLNAPRRTAAPAERFWFKVNKQQGDDACWLWTGYIDEKGYGRFNHPATGGSAHRFAYVFTYGPIAPGRELDHDCHTRDLGCLGGACLHRRCVRPEHLVAVTHLENMQVGVTARKTHCKRGHEFTLENTRPQMRSDGKLGRQCRSCDKIRDDLKHGRVTGEAIDWTSLESIDWTT